MISEKLLYIIIMTWIAPIIISQNQEENENDGDSSLRAKKYMKISIITSVLFFLGIFFFIGRSSVFSFPSIYIIIIIFSIIGVISSASRSRSRGRSQNYPQRQRRETYPLEQNTPTLKRNQNYCLQCGSKVDRNLDSLSVYYCSHCGYEIKNSRV